MAKLTYWVARCKDDSEHYNIRTKTQKECFQLLKEANPGSYDPPKKVTLEYKDAFDLMHQCTSEGWGYWEV